MGGGAPGDIAGVTTLAELARLLRQLRRREARRRGGSELTYRELAASTGWSHAIIGQYLTGKVLPPTDRFDVLTRLLAATPAEQGALATARDRVADSRHAGTGTPGAGTAAGRTGAGTAAGTAGTEATGTETAGTEAARAGTTRDGAAADQPPAGPRPPGTPLPATLRPGALPPGAQPAAATPGATPAGAMAAGTTPAGTTPAGAMGAGTTPAGTMAAGTMAAGTMAAGTMAAGTMAAGAHPVPRAVPAQLPADVAGFTGRSAELAVLDGLLCGPAGRDGGDSTAVAICAVSGTAGVGKTALAIRWAHRVRAAFADGQLYVNLRGYDPELPTAPAAALAGFLRALGADRSDLPLDVDELSARYRTAVSGRRLLVVLDNAASVEQVRPLLPGTPSCAVLVTSRDSLAGLVAQHGARRLELRLLPTADALALLRRLAGAPVAAAPGAAAELVAACARLPLALRVAAELATARAGTPLAELVAELADQRHRLDVLDAGGDPRAAVRAVLSWSYAHLPAAAARVFRLLGLHPGPDTDPHAAAALTGGSPAGTRRLLDTLARASLIQVSAPGRYGMHDLLRAYAAELAAGTDPAADRDAALTRLFDFYLATATAAMDARYPAEAHRRPRLSTVPAGRPPGDQSPDDRPPAGQPPAGQPPDDQSPDHRPPAGPALTDPAAAVAWLDAERANLTAAAHAAGPISPAHTVALASTLFRYLDASGRSADALAIHGDAVRAARRTGDAAGEAHALTNLGGVYWRQGRFAAAADHLQPALALFRQAGDRVGEARALANLGRVCFRQGRFGPAADHLEQALRLFDELDDRVGAGRTLDYLGVVRWRQGHLAAAVGHLERARALFRQLDDRLGEAEALSHLGVTGARQGRYRQAAAHLCQALARYQDANHQDGIAYALANLGLVACRQGDLDRAADHLHRALAIYEGAGDRAGAAQARTHLGVLYDRMGQPEQAAREHRLALGLFREAGDSAGEAEALNGLGEAEQAAGRPAAATSWYARALAVAVRVGDRYQQARAHHGLARAHGAGGEPDLARRHCRLALAGYTELGVPDAAELNATLALADRPGG